MTEFQYIIDQLKLKGKDNFNSDKLSDKELIENAILKISSNIKPDFMIVPVAFFVDMHRWGMVLTDSYTLIRYEDRMPYYYFRDMKLIIIWSNKFVNLNEIIIGSKRDGLWQYKPDEFTGERITVEFKKTPEGETLLLKTVFKYKLPNMKNISIIKFPEELTKLEKT